MKSLRLLTLFFVTAFAGTTLNAQVKTINKKDVNQTAPVSTKPLTVSKSNGFTPNTNPTSNPQKIKKQNTSQMFLPDNKQPINTKPQNPRLKGNQEKSKTKSSWQSEANKTN